MADPGTSPREALLWSGLTLLAAVLAAPIDWRAALLCGLAPLGARSPRWLAVCAAPLWAAAVLGGHPLAALLLVWAAAHLPRTWLGGGLLLAGGLLALRGWLLLGVVPLAASATAPLLLVGLVLGGLASGTPRGRAPAAALLLAAVGLGLGALQAHRATAVGHAALSDAVGWGLRPATPEALSDRLWLLREVPDAHEAALEVPLEAALGMGWRPEGAPLEARERITAARWLEAHQRGGEAQRLLRRGGDPLSRWWHTYLVRASGRSVAFAGEVVPDAASRWPEEAGSATALVFNQTRTIPLHLSAPVRGVEVVASADWFEGPPTLIVELDEQVHTIVPGRSPRRHRIVQDLEAGPHRLRLRYEDDRFKDGEGDRNVFVHALRGLPLSP